MHRPTRTAALVAGAVLGLTTLVAPAASASDGSSGHHRSGHTILRADLTGSMPDGPTIAMVKPGQLPWVVDEGTARVRSDGRVRVRVEGLVIPDRGTPGPVTSISASVVCNGMVVGTTMTAPLDMEGDARLDGMVWLPKMCDMPMVLVNPNGNAGAYIAATGL
ncbi:hypothetical protein [Terrabacter terrigena]|uniref:Uncharacterized protein n=1 Tax=Terrabacter terrigena TaxID=574718 RepID=A0ABW3MVC2_9MICO